MRYKITTSKTYIYLFFLLFITYSFSKNTYIAEDIKLYYVFVPSLVLFNFRYRRNLDFREVKIIFGLFFVFMLSSLGAILSHGEAINTVIHNNLRLIIIFIILLPLVYNYIKNERLFNNLFLLAIFIITIANIINHAYYYQLSDPTRFEGVFGGTNTLGFMLLLCVYMLYYMLYQQPTKKMKIFIYTLLFLLHYLLLVTVSRSAIGAAAILDTFVLYYFYKNAKIATKILSVFVAPLIILFIIGYMGYFMDILPSLGLFEGRVMNISEDGSALIRWQQIAAGLSMMEHNIYNIIFGNGTGITGNSYFFQYFNNDAMLHNNIHNTHIALLVENGIIALSLFLYLMLRLVTGASKVDNNFKAVIIGFVIALSFFASFIYMIYSLVFWLSIFIVIAHIRLIHNHGEIV